MEKIENEVEKEKSINLMRFINFLKMFDTSDYERVIIYQTCMNDNCEVEHEGKVVTFVGDEIKKNVYDIGDILVQLVKYEILLCIDCERYISFDFLDESNNKSYKRYISVICRKKEIYK